MFTTTYWVTAQGLNKEVKTSLVLTRVLTMESAQGPSKCTYVWSAVRSEAKFIWYVTLFLHGWHVKSTLGVRRRRVQRRTVCHRSSGYICKSLHLSVPSKKWKRSRHKTLTVAIFLGLTFCAARQALHGWSLWLQGLYSPDAIVQLLWADCSHFRQLKQQLHFHREAAPCARSGGGNVCEVETGKGRTFL